ncbi:Holliday junction DNA helicase RuvA [Kineosphaera limosa]|uniref:Holliday junction branch migration complex subunit RuvA n=1 Tax=Kineosphaera limosa NBRC 100340 TaxID=1184609 RepID=K6W6L0_9MICO|nr:Holliday junction branch migration protein RuvA [Kineosphaera limosa]NYD98870.1 Holliday junction DNA helicase RuvA [Kineosphaera limosa]GAB94805.1 Holliday junction ATP-dependent DNA helicase RuvA [Kineosphaera limosa NBRC 100340]
MIASVTGQVSRVGLDHLVVEVGAGGGVGLLVHTTPGTAAGARHGAQITLHTSLVVREDSLTLYGFAEHDEQATFDLVQTVSGVGPRLALAMLAVLTPAQLHQAIAAEHVVTLTKVPGIGRKGAERIVLELRDKVGALAALRADGDTPALVPEPTRTAAWQAPVIEALVGLGWTAKQAQVGVEKVAGDLGDEPEVAAALRAALRELGR